MSGLVAKTVVRKILGESSRKEFDAEDPTLASKKLERVKTALPPGISDNDAKVLTKVKQQAYRLDNALCNCFFIKFGWGSVIALFPAVGDVLDTLLSLMVFRAAMKVDNGLPLAVVVRMLINIIFDFVIGIVPFIGDLADAAFCANTKNAAILEAHLCKEGKKSLQKSLPAVSFSLEPVAFLSQRSDNEVVSAQPGRNAGMIDGNGRPGTPPAQPERARVKRNLRRGYSGTARP